jgi:hypothetical protein
LAALEYLVHVDINEAPADLVAIEIEVPEDAGISEVRARDLPPDWNLVEEHPTCIAHGDEWAAAAKALALRVPSAVIPHESNVLLNPRHADAGRIRIIAVHDFVLDPRTTLALLQRLNPGKPGSPSIMQRAHFRSSAVSGAGGEGNPAWFSGVIQLSRLQLPSIV